MDEYLQTEGVVSSKTHFNDYPSCFEKEKKLVREKGKMLKQLQKILQGNPISDSAVLLLALPSLRWEEISREMVFLTLSG